MGYLIKSAESIDLFFVWYGVTYPAPRMTRSDAWRRPPRDCVAKYWAFKDELVLCARQNGFRVGYRITHLDALVYLPLPAGAPKRIIGQPHDKKPDLDNLCKSILDALSDHDQSCWSIGLEKRYDDGKGPRLEIRIKVMENS